MNILRIAVRNILRQKKRSFLLGGAIAFGVMIITIIGSFSRGITETAAANFTDILGGQLYITGQELTPTGGQVSVIREREVLEDALEAIEDDIAERTVRSRVFVEIIFGSKNENFSIEGVDWADEPELANGLTLSSGTISTDFKSRALVIPISTAEALGIEVGETALVRTSTVTGQQSVGEFEICAIIDDNTSLPVSSGYADRKYLNSIIGLGEDDYQTLNIALKNPSAADEATKRVLDFLSARGKTEPVSTEEVGIMGGMRSRMASMGALMGGGAFFGSRVEESERWEGTRFSVLNINDTLEPVMSMVNVLNTVSYVIFIVLMFITMIGILNTFRMILIERTQEIGTMRAIGMQRSEVRNLFLSEALVLAIGGALFGIVIATVLNGVLGIIPFSTDSPMQFFLSGNTLAFPIVPASIIITFLIVSIITLTSAYLPARSAAKLDPAVALRTHY